MKLPINLALLKICFVIVICLFSYQLQAQKRTNALKLNLANVLLGFPTLQYEHSLGKKLSYQFGIGFYSRANRGWNQNGAVITINGQVLRRTIKIAIVSADIRYYFLNKSKVKMKGLYISPHILSTSPQFYEIAFGGNLGYQYIGKKGLVINLGGGISYEYERAHLNNFITAYPRINTSVGYCF